MLWAPGKGSDRYISEETGSKTVRPPWPVAVCQVCRYVKSPSLFGPLSPSLSVFV